MVASVLRCITLTTKASIEKKPALIGDFWVEIYEQEHIHKNLSTREIHPVNKVSRKGTQRRSFSQIEQTSSAYLQKSSDCPLFYLYCLVSRRKTLRKSVPILDKNRFADNLIHKTAKTPPIGRIERSTMAKKGLDLEKMSKMVYSVRHEAGVAEVTIRERILQVRATNLESIRSSE